MPTDVYQQYLTFANPGSPSFGSGQVLLYLVRKDGYDYCPEIAAIWQNENNFNPRNSNLFRLKYSDPTKYVRGLKICRCVRPYPGTLECSTIVMPKSFRITIPSDFCPDGKVPTILPPPDDFKSWRDDPNLGENPSGQSYVMKPEFFLDDGSCSWFAVLINGGQATEGPDDGSNWGAGVFPLPNLSEETCQLEVNLAWAGYAEDCPNAKYKSDPFPLADCQSHDPTVNPFLGANGTVKVFRSAIDDGTSVCTPCGDSGPVIYEVLA